jgi:DNA repair protein RadC
MSQQKIREMPQDERPREKLLARGPDALTNPELIAILLRTGRRGMNVIEVARELLDKYKSFAELSRCSVKELRAIKGIGPAKALELVAAFNLGKRFAQEPLFQQKLDSPELIHELLGREMRMLRIESLRVVLLDTRYRLMRVESVESVSVGSMNESIAHPREIFRPAITYSAYAVIVVHNHPSGDASPSQTDHSLTRRLAEAAELLQIKLLDHIIIGAPSETNPGYFSFKEAGVL